MTQSHRGDVRIVAEFPDRAPVVLSELSENDPPRKSTRKRAHAQAQDFLRILRPNLGRQLPMALRRDSVPVRSLACFDENFRV